MNGTECTLNGDIHDKRTYTVEEIAAILKIGKKAAYNLVREQPFKTVRIGTAIRISKASFDQWLDNHDKNH